MTCAVQVLEQGTQTAFPKKRMLAFLRKLGLEFCPVPLTSDGKPVDKAIVDNIKRRSTDDQGGEPQSIWRLKRRGGASHPERPRYAARHEACVRGAWEDGIFLGVRSVSGETTVGSAGVWRTRTVQRRTDAERWEPEDADLACSVYRWAD